MSLLQVTMKSLIFLQSFLSRSTDVETLGSSIYKSFLYNSYCRVRNRIERQLIIAEKLMVIGQPSLYR